VRSDIKGGNAVLAGGGELGRRMREIDWAKTPLGPVDSWPQSLRTCIRIVLTSQQPMFVWWGEQLINLYNDAYISILGGKHPAALGQPAQLVWREIWADAGVRAAKAMREDEGTFDEALMLIMERNGYREETYYTFSYSPVPGDDGNPGGILCANSSDTRRIFGDRQQALLREVAARTANARTVRDACGLALEAFATDRKDLPFALLYTVDGGVATLSYTAGIAAGHRLAVPTIDPATETAWPVAEVLAGAPIALRRLSEPDLPSGDWPEPPGEAIAIPVRGADQSLAAVLVVGRNPFRLLDDDYRRFLDLLAIQIGNAMSNARTFEEERRRAEALAELDRAKTTFFSNISHEFRTPLTLMLGPTEDALRSAGEALSGEALRAVHRNELRLLKLVNALLDFSRIEAGRLQVHSEPTDLARFTRELASAFHSAIERAGLAFEVSIAPFADRVSVDRGMWEKIVLNLLSNALKFTFEGHIELQLAERGGLIELVVADTGIGIAEHDIPRLFERFHRVEGARARTHEGSGIGLALTSELVRLHHGTIDVASELGRGTRFTVRIPARTARAAVAGGDSAEFAPVPTAFVEEALRWFPAEESLGAGTRSAAPPLATALRDGSRARIVVADDNSDMREYLRRLLAERWDVVTVPDGMAAVEACRASRPDLVLSDVMMPNLDGFGLLRAMRADPALASIPIVMLSARAGEEARIDGIEAGADDYLIKPFSARELIARVSNMLQLSQLRTDAVLANRAKDEFLAMLGHELRNPLAPILTALELMRLRGGDLLVRERTIIERQTMHLASLVDDLLDVSRIARGMVELKRERVGIADALAKAIETASPLFEQQSHELVTHVARGLAVEADPGRLVQVFANLLTNAAKYTDPRGCITVTAEAHGEEVIVAVTDTGRGIAADMLPHVFELFVQERQNLDRSRGGLGLGLAIVRNLVALHGGRVTATSEGPGRGSTFSVHLPRAADDTAAASADVRVAPGAAEPADSGAVSVLVVDDNFDAATLLGDLLRARGYRIQIAHDAPETLQLAQHFVPDVALIDIGLPAMDGYELARRLRELPAWQSVKLHALTGYGQSGDRERSRAAGFDRHLIKPIDLATLEAVLPSVAG
jgi:signal transduction histidine kinase